MYETVWKEIDSALSEERLWRDLRATFDFTRWSSFDKFDDLRAFIRRELSAAGLEVEDLSPPADGTTNFAGWTMPLGYKVNRAILRGASPGTELLVDYAATPQALMLYSLGEFDSSYELEVLTDPRSTASVAGKLVLLSNIGAFDAQALLDSGAVGILCDSVPRARFIKEGEDLDETFEWRNYALPLWAARRPGFGFSLTPKQGARLRESRSHGPVKLHAQVSVEAYPGRVPLVGGLIRGESDREILLLGHCDECGADDNGSQVAAMLELARVLGERYRRRGRPARSIRFLFVMEVRSLQAYVRDEARARRVICGLNIDTIGTDQNLATTLCSLGENFPSNPGFADDLAAELLRYLATCYPTFRWQRRSSDLIDNILGEPLIGGDIPQLFHFSKHHHTGLDLPENVSTRTLKGLATVAGTFAAFLAEAGVEEASWLLGLVRTEGLGRLGSLAAPSGRRSEPERNALVERYRSKLLSVSRLFSDPPYQPTSEEVAKLQLFGDRLTPAEFLREEARRLSIESLSPYLPTTSHHPRNTDPHRTLVPVKLFRGFLGCEGFSEEEAVKLGQAGVGPGWGAPMWVQHLLFLANGKRSLGDILALLEQERYRVDAKAAADILGVLEARKLVRFRPYLTRADIQAALEKLGVRRGDNLIMHASLSRFGYIEGGAETLIEAVLAAIGREGTLMMPTFTYSWIGHPPYDSTKTLSRVGAVSNVFWQKYADLRGAHPTHSFAVRGPKARFLLEGQLPSDSPVGRSSPPGRLYDLDGKVLLLCPMLSNTSFHCGEYWAGIPYLRVPCRIIEHGLCREVVVEGMPWHSRFDDARNMLAARGAFREAQLGENTAYAVSIRDSVDAQVAVATQTPERLLEPGCSCTYCTELREYCKKRGRET